AWTRAILARSLHDALPIFDTSSRPFSQITSPALCGGRVDEVQRIWPSLPSHQCSGVTLSAVIALAPDSTLTAASGNTYTPLRVICRVGLGAVGDEAGVPVITCSVTSYPLGRPSRATMRSIRGLPLLLAVSGTTMSLSPVSHMLPRSRPRLPARILTARPPVPSAYTTGGSPGAPNTPSGAAVAASSSCSQLVTAPELCPGRGYEMRLPIRSPPIARAGGRDHSRPAATRDHSTSLDCRQPQSPARPYAASPRCALRVRRRSAPRRDPLRR